MRSTRVFAIAAAVLLVALVAGAVTIVATSQGTTRPAPAHLAVGPGPLRTATGILTYADHGGISVAATFGLDFAHHAANATATASFSVESVTLEARLLDGLLYLGVGSLATLTGAPWVVASVPTADAALDAIGATLRHPDLASLHADHATVAKTGSVTVTTMHFDEVTLPSTSGLPITLPSSGHLDLVVTTGAAGQVLRTTVHLFNATSDVRAGMQITGYNVPVAVGAPSRELTEPLTLARTMQIFGSNAPAVIVWLRRFGVSLP